MSYAQYSITEEVPVSDHVYKFLTRYVGADFYEAKRTDLLGNIILSSLNKNADTKKHDQKYTKSFKLIIKEGHYVKNGVNLSIRNGQIFNFIADQFFREMLFHHIIFQKNAQNDMYLKAMRNFLDWYNITEEDIKLESLWKDFTRKKPAILRKKTTADNLPKV